MFKFHRLALVLLLLNTSFWMPESLRAQTNQPLTAPSAKLTAEQWREDLHYFTVNMAKTHKNLFHNVSSEDFEAAVKKLADRVPSLADHEILIELMRIVALIGDGHTGVRVEQRFNLGVYPLRLYWYKDGLFVQAAAPEYREAVGARVVKIGNTETAEALRAVREITWRDNEMGVKALAPQLLVVPEVLHALRLSNDLTKAEFVIEKNGRVQKLELKPSGRLRHERQLPDGWVDARADAKAPVPLWLKDPDNTFWFEPLGVREGTGSAPTAPTAPKTGGILYVQFNGVANKPAVGNDLGETLAAFFGRVFDYVETNKIDKLVLDLRLNGGGNNFLNLPMTIGMIKSRVNQRGKLFVIIGRETFSAAQNAVNELEKYTNAIFVGEPTAATPNHYGDARNVVLPNSRISVGASTLWWQDADPRDTRRWTAPQIAAQLTAADYSASVDPAMKAILNYVPEKSLPEILSDALATGGETDLIKQYRAYRDDPAHAYIETEAALNQLGYTLMAKNNPADLARAIAVFQLNVDENPQSANVYDSLAEAYLTKGDKELAIKYYSKALEVDPNFASALEALRRLKSH